MFNNIELLEIKIIRKYFRNGKVHWSGHAIERLKERDIRIKDIEKALDTGQIIEKYVDSVENPSCLILGYMINGRAIHIVCGINTEVITIITVYYPEYSKWSNDFKIRKRKGNEV